MKKKALRLYSGLFLIEMTVIVLIMLIMPRPALLSWPPDVEIPDWMDPGLLEPEPPMISTWLGIVMIAILIIAALALIIGYIVSKKKGKDDGNDEVRTPFPPPLVPPLISSTKTKEDEMTSDIAKRSAFNAFLFVVPQLLVGVYVFMLLDNWFGRETIQISIGLMASFILFVGAYSISYFIINGRLQRDG